MVNGISHAPPITTSNEVTDRSITDAYRQFMGREGRNLALWKYYIGDHPDVRSDKGEDATAPITANLCKYITRTLQGYMVGNRPQYTNADGDELAQEISDLFNAQSKWEVESAIAQDMSIYGRGFELVYRGADGTPKSAAISPRDAFVAYSTDIEHDSIFGAVRQRVKRPDGTYYIEVYVYTATDVSVWRSEDTGTPSFHIAMEPQPHGLGRVPLIEYANNREFMGDFEDIIPLQDAYNSLLSDRQDDKDAFASTILAIKGMVLGNNKAEVAERAQALRDQRILQLDDDADAFYLTKTMDETSVQILQDQYAKDIHKIAMVPDLSDDQFSGNASGVAMAYKLYGTDQVASEKVARFQKGYQRRCKLYDWALHNPSNSDSYKPIADISKMAITFRFNLVQDLGYTATALSTLKASGMISTKTAVEQLAIVPDATQELERIAEDQETAINVNQRMYEDYPMQFGDEGE